MSCCLLLFYLLVLWDAHKLDVTEEYRMYYVTKELLYHLNDGMLENYTINEEYEYNKQNPSYNIDIGWSEFDSNGAWMLGESSSFYFWIDEVLKKNYYLVIKFWDQLDYERKLYVNGNLIEGFCSEGNEYQVLIPGKYLQSGINKFNIRTENVKEYKEINPGTDIDEKLTIYVKSIGLYDHFS